MNILPHKSWHVRTKKNIARVREDERKAAENELDIKKRVARAEQEYKLNLLRNRSQRRSNETKASPAEHVNFFQEVEDGKYVSTKDNAEHVEEKKNEQETYEKKIGYLTYLGQDTNEMLKKRDWYEALPDRTEKYNEDGSKIEVSLKSKLLHDPLVMIHKYVGSSASIIAQKSESEVNKLSAYESILTESIRNYRLKKRKRHRSSSCASSNSSRSKKRSKKSKKKKSKKKRKMSRKSSTDSSDDEELRKLKQQKLEALRVERLNREKIEREKVENLLKKLRGEAEPKQQEPIKIYKQKYNSQFNPDIARQNQD